MFPNEKCKKDLAECSLLFHPIKKAKVRLVTDASDSCICGSLEKSSSRGWKPLVFFPRKFSGPQLYRRSRV